MPPGASRSSMPVEPASQASAASRSAAAVSATRAAKHATGVCAAALTLLLLSTTGCYLGHVARGQARLLGASRPIEEVLADPDTSPDLARQLEAVQRARTYAKALGLEVDQQYTSFVAWPGDRVLTTVVATRPGEVEPAGFWFPFLGRLPYKGFFDPARAEALAAELRKDGLDVCVVPVPAYSTLGWLDDPVTGPMLLRGEGSTVETIFHELVHATVYVKDHADFNETVATFIGQEASVRFYDDSKSDEEARRRRAAVQDQRALANVLVGLREQIAMLYANQAAGPSRDAAREKLVLEARAQIAALAFSDRDAATLAQEIRLNDACLALSGTYGAEMSRYVAKLAALGGDLPTLVGRLRTVADAPDPAEAFLAP